MLRARLAAALLLLLLPACGSKTADDPAKKEGSRIGTLKDGQVEAPKKDAKPSWPQEPIEFEVSDFEPQGTIDIGGVKVQNADGKEVKLSSLMRDRTLLYFIDNNTDDKQNRASTRQLRKVIQSGRGLGFRVVVILEQGTLPEEIGAWFKKRQVARTALGVVDHKGEFAKASGWKSRTAALTDAKGRIKDLFPPSEGWHSRLGHEPALTSDILISAWELPDSGPAIDAATKQAAVDLVRATLRAAAKGAEVDAALVSKVSGKNEHGAWVSLFRPGTTTRLKGTSTDGKLGPALVAATKEALESAKAERQEWNGAIGDVRFAIDLAGKPGPIKTRYIRSLWYLVEPGVTGIILKNGDKVGISLPGEPVTDGWLTPRVLGRTDKIEKIMGKVSRLAGASKDAWKAEDSDLQRFRTTSFGVVTPDGDATDFFRGNVILPPDDPSEEQVMESIRIGGRWLANTVMPDGKFDYEYYPNTDRNSRGYNIVRHAGSVYGLFEMFELSRTEKALKKDQRTYIDGAAKAMSYIYDALGTPKGAPEDRVCLIDNKRCESGSAALTLLTFIARPEKKDTPKDLHDKLYRADDQKTMDGLALAMVDMIDERGKVFRRYSESIKLDKVKKEPLYYPGEVMLALVRYYAKTKDERWLKAAQKIADRQVKSYKRDRFQTPDHWVMQAYLPLYEITKNEEYAKSARNMAMHYASEIYPVMWQPFPDYKGSWRRGNDQPRTTRAGSRSEALRAVMKLAWLKGEDADIWERTLILASRHLMEQQFSTRNQYWLPNFAKVEGAYPMGVTDNHCRIDNNQHALVGMVGAVEAIRHRKGK